MPIELRRILLCTPLRRARLYFSLFSLLLNKNVAIRYSYHNGIKNKSKALFFTFFHDLPLVHTSWHMETTFPFSTF